MKLREEETLLATAKNGNAPTIVSSKFHLFYHHTIKSILSK